MKISDMKEIGEGLSEVEVRKSGKSFHLYDFYEICEREAKKKDCELIHREGKKVYKEENQSERKKKL